MLENKESYLEVDALEEAWVPCASWAIPGAKIGGQTVDGSLLRPKVAEVPENPGVDGTGVDS